MVQETTLEATSALVSVATTSVDIKRALNVPGYEAQPDRLQIEQNINSRNVNVELQGKVDPRTGERGPVDPGGLSTVRELLGKSPEEREQIIAAAHVVESTAEEVSDADAAPTEFPPEPPAPQT